MLIASEPSRNCVELITTASLDIATRSVCVSRERYGRSDRFLSGTTFDDVVSLYNFDARLRVAVLAVLAPVELSMRALVGHVLG